MGLHRLARWPLALRPLPSGAQYEVSDDQDSVQMLQRSSQVGEFYRMMPPAVWDPTRVLPAQYMVRRSR